MLENVDRIAWLSLAQPRWNREDAVPTALRGLGLCVSESTSRDAYDKVLDALGNNHAGTYYPVVLAALPFFGEILQGGGEWARIATLDILVDLSGSFAPESGFEMVVSPTGERSALRVLLQQGIAGLSAQIRAFAMSDTAGQRERELASELLNCLKESEAEST